MGDPKLIIITYKNTSVAECFLHKVNETLNVQKAADSCNFRDIYRSTRN